MGDARRFDLMAKLVDAEFPQYTENPVADVAGGKGYLQASLRQRGWERITTIDRRHRLAKGRPGQKYGLFTYNTVEKYSLVLGMHPDEATDHIILYAAKNFVPFVVCPCCVKPDAKVYSRNNNLGMNESWLNHLKTLALPTHTIKEVRLLMDGKNLVLIGRVK